MVLPETLAPASIMEQTTILNDIDPLTKEAADFFAGYATALILEKATYEQVEQCASAAEGSYVVSLIDFIVSQYLSTNPVPFPLIDVEDLNNAFKDLIIPTC